LPASSYDYHEFLPNVLHVHSQRLERFLQRRLPLQQQLVAELVRAKFNFAMLVILDRLVEFLRRLQQSMQQLVEQLEQQPPGDMLGLLVWRPKRQSVWRLVEFMEWR
jgi:hypothetical protein